MSPKTVSLLITFIFLLFAAFVIAEKGFGLGTPPDPPPIHLTPDSPIIFLYGTVEEIGIYRYESWEITVARFLPDGQKFDRGMSFCNDRYNLFENKGVHVSLMYYRRKHQEFCYDLIQVFHIGRFP